MLIYDAAAGWVLAADISSQNCQSSLWSFGRMNYRPSARQASMFSPAFVSDFAQYVPSLYAGCALQPYNIFSRHHHDDLAACCNLAAAQSKHILAGGNYHLANVAVHASRGQAV